MPTLLAAAYPYTVVLPLVIANPCLIRFLTAFTYLLEGRHPEWSAPQKRRSVEGAINQKHALSGGCLPLCDLACLHSYLYNGGKATATIFHRGGCLSRIYTSL